MIDEHLPQQSNFVVVAPAIQRKLDALGGSVVAAPSGAVRPPSGVYPRFVKPAVERFIAAVLLLVLSPVLGAIFAAVWLQLGRPVVYAQQRVGRHGEVFVIYKVRTMRPDRRGRAAAYDGAERRNTHKSDRDPRHTPFGRWLRRSSLDELPQLWNVVKGEMSLIGPRPELVDVVAREGLWDHPRNYVRPGITGLWQISPARGGEIRLGLAYDLAYVSHIGWRTDARIAVATLSAVVTNPGR